MEAKTLYITPGRDEKYDRILGVLTYMATHGYSSMSGAAYAALITSPVFLTNQRLADEARKNDAGKVSV